MMKKSKGILIGLLFITLCAYAQDKKSEKEAKSEIAYSQTKELLNSGQFVFIAERAVAVGGGSVSLITTPNHIRIDQGNADIYLPYYGEIRGVGSYSTDAGIKYQGPINNYKQEFKDAKRRIILKFDLRSNSDAHNFILTVNRKRETKVVVISATRTTISYYGIIRPLNREKDY